MSDNNDTELDPIESVIIKANPEIFSGLNEVAKKELIRSLTITVKQTISHHQGPIPSWEILEKYNQLIPNGADRIMGMAESQSRHRMNIEAIAINEQLRQSARGQVFGFIIGMVVILSGFTCIMTGHGWEGTFLGVGGVTGLVSVFVYGKQQQSKNLNSKS